jgi:hypothetical protein
MRRILLLAIGALALALAAPSAASAHGRHHHGHHGKHHHKHKHAHRANLSGPAAGTIASFDGTTLILTLADGSTVSGAVTDETVIALIEVTPAATAAHHGDWGDDDDDDGDRWWRGHSRCGFDEGDASDLVAGATVWKATLELGPDGAVFEKVKLLVPDDDS